MGGEFVFRDKNYAFSKPQVMIKPCEYPRVFLIGPMGAGKSTIGRQLAAALAYEFLDTDAEIESRCGADIPWIFDVEGEEGFRNRETAVLTDLCDKSQVVIATGGGIVMREANRALLASAGYVIYLRASLSQQLERTGRDRKRPLLQVDNPETVLKSLIAEREPFYKELADTVVRTDRRGAKRIAREIAEKLRTTS